MKKNSKNKDLEKNALNYVKERMPRPPEGIKKRVQIIKKETLKLEGREFIRIDLSADYLDEFEIMIDAASGKTLGWKYPSKYKEIRLEQERSRMIRLRVVEFDTSKEIPSPPPTLSLSADETKRKKSNYWIVQFVGPVEPEWSEKIKALGGKLHNYIPDNAFLIYMGSQTKENVEKLPFVNWIGLYEPVYKVSPLLMGIKKKVSPGELSTLSINTESFKPAPAGNVNVLSHDPADIKKVSQEIEKLGGMIIATAKNRVRASIDLSRADKIAKMAEVKWIEPYTPPKLFNDVAAGIISVQPVWDNHGLDGSEQIVAVADTGLDTGVNDATMHDDFEGRIVSIHDRVGDGANDVKSGHGTHVAGSVLGNGSRSGGDIRGMAFAASLVFQALENNTTEDLSGIPADLNQLFQQAYDDGARIHNNSWGDSSHGQYTTDSQDIDEFMWNHKDMIILFAASNDGTDANNDGVIDNDSLSSQACSKNCITVGASENNRSTGGYQNTYGHYWPGDYSTNPIRDDHLSDNPEGMVAFSSRGPTDDGRPKPDVVAPGTNILSVRSSAASEHGWGLLPAGDSNRPYYMYMGGTSMATPITTGTVALIRQYLQEVRRHANPSGALLKAIPIHGATPITGQYTPPEVGAVPDNNQGWGRVNLRSSLFPDDPVEWGFEDNPADTLGTGEHKDFAFRVADNTVPLRATLVWTDHPSDPTTGGRLVNTLRLLVTDPGGTTVQSEPSDNNVQQVVVNSPQTGTYTVQVTGINVATQTTTGDKQDFALVVSGGLDFSRVYPANPGPLPASKLCNKNPPYNPIQGDGPLGNQYRGRMFYRGDDKEELVTTLQMMLDTLGYDIGTAGVDGKFGDDTEKAVRQFQEENKDWEGNKLKVDGLVGPRTSDALNRAMVGRWYDHYQTPKELVEGKPYHTVTSEFLINGLSIEPDTTQEAKVFLIGEIPESPDKS